MNRTHMKTFPDGISAEEKFRPPHRVTSNPERRIFSSIMQLLCSKRMTKQNFRTFKSLIACNKDKLFLFLFSQ